MTLEEIIELLEKNGIIAQYINHDKNGYSRAISFKVYEIEYRIVWFCNESTLKVGASDRSACIPFKYCYYDTTFPLIGGNKSIGFSYSKSKKLLRDFPYEVFRIPIEIKQKA